MDGAAVVGYMQLSVQRRFVAVQHLAVLDSMQRRGIGTALLGVALDQLAPLRPLAIADVPESTRYLAAQCFFRRHGFVGRAHPREPRLLRFDYRLPATAA